MESDSIFLINCFVFMSGSIDMKHPADSENIDIMKVHKEKYLLSFGSYKSKFNGEFI